MTKYFFLILFFPIYLIGKSQSKPIVICGKVFAKEKFIVKIYEPINGYYNLAQLDTNQTDNIILVNHKDSIYKQISTLNQPAFVTILFTNNNNGFINRTDLLVIPGDSIHINFDLKTDKLEWASYTGSNAAGHQLFNKINYSPIEIYTDLLKALDKLSITKNNNQFIDDIDSSVIFFTRQMNTIFKSSMISKEYLESMNLSFQLMLYNFACSHLVLPSKGSNLISHLERKLILETLFKKFSPVIPKLKGLFHSELYLKSYYGYLACEKAKVEYINGLENDTFLVVNNKVITLSKFEAPFIYIEDKSQQADIWALNLLRIYSLCQGALDKTSIERFNQLFPNTNWEKYLTTQLKNHSPGLEINYKLQTPVEFIDSTKKVESLTVLIGIISMGKPMFIDIWASWCGPCIGAFSYNQQLDSFLLENNIKKIYISIDSDAEKWKGAIEKYSLGGYHALANEKLIDDIKIICRVQNEIGLRIPRYIFVNRNGKIINTDATSPVDIYLLKKEIKKALLEK